MKCPICNTIEHESGARFCHKCGNALIPDGRAQEISLPSMRSFTVNGVSFNMILVEGGSFMMGAQKDDPTKPNYDPEADPFESPVHQETVNTFYIGETPVTLALWKAILRDTRIDYLFQTYNAPVVPVSIAECIEFCSELMAQTGELFRLPTEIEWEFAARGGKRSKGYRFSGSNILTNVGLYRNNTPQSETGLCIVKQKQPNELGIYDMSGLVQEWCLPLYDYRNKVPLRDYVGNRGGNWYCPPFNCRISCRNRLQHSVYYYDHEHTDSGFRRAMIPKL